MPGAGSRFRSVLMSCLGLCVLGLLWQAVIYVQDIPAVLLPGPALVWRTAVAHAGELAAAGRATLYEILLASLIAIIGGYATAVALCVLPSVRRTLWPYMLTTQVVPKVALAPILIAWLGIGTQSRLVLAFLIAYFPMVINMLDALLDTDRAMLAYARSLAASDWQTLLKVRLPAALPATLAGAKITLSLATIGVVVGEFVASDTGLGKVVVESAALLQTALMIAATLAIGAIGLTLLGAVEILEGWLVKWQR